METQNSIKLGRINEVAKDIFVLFGSTSKTCKVEFNLKTDKVRKINQKTKLDSNSIVFNRKTLEALSQKVEISDLETRMTETIRRGLLKALNKLNVKVVEPVSEVVETVETQPVVFIARFTDTNELLKFNHENIDQVLDSNRPFKINLVENMILKELENFSVLKEVA